MDRRSQLPSLSLLSLPAARGQQCSIRRDNGFYLPKTCWFAVAEGKSRFEGPEGIKGRTRVGRLRSVSTATQQGQSSRKQG